MLNKLALGLTIAMSSSMLMAANTQMQIKTTMGNIEIELFDDKAPISAKNF
mgnify:FL=1